MRIQHNTARGERPAAPYSRQPQGKRALEKSKSREGWKLAQLLLSVLLFLGVFGSKNLLPEQSQPVMEQIQTVISSDLDFRELSLQVSAVLQGEESVRSVFRTILTPSEEGESQRSTETTPVMWLGVQERPQWLS